MLIGWVKGSGAKGKDVKGKGKGVLMQAEKERDDAKKLAQKNKDKQCFHCRRKKGHVKCDCRDRQCVMKKARDSGKPFVDRKQTAAITENQVWAITPSDGKGWLFS